MDDEPDFEAEGFVQCEYCQGWFDTSDMRDDHCADCFEELFGDD
jgi:hypothetical protein